jgi:energy-coupling factor transporter ATP-binding protein EcfA2
LDGDEGKPILLKEISGLENVNALVPEQRLTFGEQLTAIFGHNGSGKSGYARMIGAAGFTRGDQEVLPNVTEPFDVDKPIKATVQIDIDGESKSISYEAKEPCPELSSFYVFDSTSVQVHMKGKNTFSFSPSGLSILTKLSNVTDEVRKRLKEKIEQVEGPGEFEKYFTGESKVRTLIEKIGAETNINELEKLAELTESEENRIHELEVEIGKIGLGQHKEEIEKQIHNLRMLHSWLTEASELFDQQEISKTNRKIERYQKLQERAKELSIESFQHEKFSQIGSELWGDFIRTAYQLADAESQDEKSYPQEDDVCLLCHQTLDQDTRELILKLWDYLAGEVRSEIQDIEKLLQKKKEEIIEAENFSLDVELSDSIKTLSEMDSVLGKQVSYNVDFHRSVGQKVLNALRSKKKTGEIESKLENNCSSSILEIIERLEKEISDEQRQVEKSKIGRLEDERRFLEHRKRLTELLPDVKEYVEQQVWAEKASRIGGSTRHITRKHNELFDQLVKNRYIKIFEKTLENLGRPLQVDIATSGRKGKTVKQIQLQAHETAEDIADPEKVLSEGEKRAVALADFLTEARLDTTSNGIVLDDPVTSLDLEWRKAIARILVKEADKRQVVIFTHDMPFLYHLLNFSDECDLKKKVHWIKRGDLDDRPGYVYIDNCPALEKEYKSSQLARELYKTAKDAEAEAQAGLIREGMAALRTSYEALVVFELFGGVVMRFDERISIGRLPSLVWNDEILKEIDENYGKLSRYIEGHLHSDALAGPLTIKMLMNEIETFDALRKKIKELKKQKRKS